MDRDKFLVRMDGGDGYCGFFSSPQILLQVHVPWFPKYLDDWGDASLFRIEGGAFNGTHVAFTRFDKEAQEFLSENGVLSVVAHHILNPTETFSSNDTDSCGKTVIFLVD